jgi:phosphoribosyl 1,2-cyclic phosphodiesterase
MRVSIWGARGSLSDSGPEHARYGGNTSCVEVEGEGGTVLVLDAGTGARKLGREMSGKVKKVDVLLTHFHMDHIQGLGFFAPMFNPEVEVTIWGPPSTTLSMHERLTRYLSPPLFPLRIRDFDCRWTLRDAPRGRFEIGEFTVEANLVSHPNPTMGYRVKNGSGTIAYIPDHEVALGADWFPQEPEWTSGYEIAKDVDLLIHDTQYRDDEYPGHIGWGHSTTSQSITFAKVAGAKRLVTFHHDPSHDDAAIDGVVMEARALSEGKVEVIGGAEGATFQV